MKGENLRTCRSGWWGPLALPFIDTALCWASCVLGMLMQGGGKKIGSRGPNWHTDWFDGKLGRQDVWSCNRKRRYEIEQWRDINQYYGAKIVIQKYSNVPWFHTIDNAFRLGIQQTNMPSGIWHIWNYLVDFLPENDV